MTNIGSNSARVSTSEQSLSLQEQREAVEQVVRSRTRGNACVIYTRSATDNNETQMQQIEQCRQYAVSNGYAILAEFDDVSGGHSLERPGLEAAVAFLRRYPVTLVTPDKSRLSRKQHDLLNLLDTLREYGVSVTTVE